MRSYEKSFCHNSAKWEEFNEKYAKELKSKRDLLHKIKQIEKEKRTSTLPYAAKDEEPNKAVALSNILKSA